MELNFDKQIIWYQTRTFWRKQIAPFDLAPITSVWDSANDIALASSSTWTLMARPRKFHASPVPAWACRIRALREGLRLNQVQFGKRLRCSPITISRWERGLQRPAADRLIAIGKMVGRSTGWYFWKMAGIGKNDVKRMMRSSGH
jgi:DNA-binding transcriptional regulator YiaG